MNLGEAILIALGSGAVSGLIAWGGLRVEIVVMKRAIEAAHDRLDKLNAPPARVRL